MVEQNLDMTVVVASLLLPNCGVCCGRNSKLGDNTLDRCLHSQLTSLYLKSIIPVLSGGTPVPVRGRCHMLMALN